MLRAFLARAAAIAALCAPLLGCSSPDRAAEGRVSSLNQALDGGTAGGGGAADAGPAGAGPVDAGPADSGPADSAPACTSNTDCGNGCGVCTAGVCSIASAMVTCRSAVGVCDADDKCDGVSKDCPVADAKQPSTTVCRPANGLCDVDDLCDGVHDACPADAKQPSTFTCRAANGLCDVDDKCDGTTNACPDAVKANGASCRPAVDSICDIAEVCDGHSAACPADAVQPTTVACRPAVEICDVPDSCDGAGHCAADAKQPAGHECRGAAGECDAAEVCDGTNNTCPVDSKQPSGHDCGTIKGLCDKPDHCDGFTNTCSTDSFLDKDTVCRPANGPCDIADKCNGTDPDCPSDAFMPSTTECQALSCANATVKPQILCSGTAAACPVVADVSCGNFACGSATECRTTCLTSNDCGAAFYCLNNDCVPRIGAGQACKSDAQCSTSNAHCVDGVCCDTTCVGQCEACNLPGKVGTCTGVTGDPIAPRAKCAADGTKCDGFCDPSNRTACQFPTTATSCRDAACDTATNAALAESFCTGKGSCALTKSSDCEPYACSGTACAGNCTADAQCAADAYCQSGKCTPKAALAAKCTTDKQCGSGHCADGVCCDTECSGECEACSKVPNAKAGTCSPVTGAPLGKRTACAATDAACGGACDGANRQTCAYPTQGKVCRDGACADGQAIVTGYCDGHGACPAEQTIACEKGCEGAVCAGDECLLDSDCKGTDKYCAAGVCTAKAAPGSACSSASACSTGFCTDGVCCDSACLGQCEACDASGSMGTCSAVPKGDSPHGGRTSCITDGSVCGGACDGSARTSCKYPLDKVCRAGSCVAGVGPDDPATSVVEASCIGNGRCPAEQEQLCGQDGCDSSNALCDGACAIDENACKSGEYCSAGECVPKLGVAAACANSAECASKFCVDGVCCNKSCSDQCAACDVPGSVGTCTPVIGAAHGGRAACAGVGSCGAACDGNIVASCSFAAANVSCGDAFCSAGIKGAAPACDGEGVCAPAQTTACSSFACDGAECSNACSSDADCVKQFECRKGVCLPPILIDAVDEGTCGCAVPGPRPRAPAAPFLLLGLCLAAALRRRRAAQVRA